MPLHIIENGFIMLLIELILLIINGWRISVLYSTIMFKQMEFFNFSDDLNQSKLLF